MGTQLRLMALLFGSTLALATENPAPPVAALRGIDTVNVEIQSLCGFEDFDNAAAVIMPDVRRALVASKIKVVHSKHDDSQPTLAFIIHCQSIRWEDGAPILGEGPTAQSFIYVVSTRLSRRVAITGVKTIHSDAVVWSQEGWMRALSKRPFVTLREDILGSVRTFVAEWEKARDTSGG
jgi:hypothetical protein